MYKSVVLKSVLKSVLEHLMRKVMSIEFILVKITINKEYDWSMKFILN